MPDSREYRVTIHFPEDPRTEHNKTFTIREIRRGEHDEMLEDILEAAHHRKREIRERRYGHG